MVMREKILIILCAIAGLYLAVYMFMGQNKKDLPAPTNEMSLTSADKFAEKQLLMFKKFEQRDADEMIIKKADVKWHNDPFADLELLKQIEGTSEEEPPGKNANKEKHEPLLYSGFLQVGNKLMAIVNGMEYEKGDTIEGTYYKVFSISTSTESIMLRSPDSVITTVQIKDDVRPEQDRRDKSL